LESIEQAKELGEKLKVQQDVVLLFISPSGRGLKVVHQLKVENTSTISVFHNSAFLRLEERYKTEFNIDIDQSGKDLARLCFLCHDPEVYYNAEASHFKVEPLISKPKSKVNVQTKGACVPITDKADSTTIFILDSIVSFLRKKNLSITKTYDEWMRIGFALKRELGENEGRTYFHKFAKLDDNYDQNKANHQFDNGTLNHDKEVRLGTIIYMAQEQGYKLPSLSKEQKFIMNKRIATERLEEMGIQIRYNSFKAYREIKYDNKEWKQVQDYDLSYFYVEVMNNNFTKGEADDWLWVKAKKSIYNPMMELIEKLATHDGKDYIGQLANTITAEDPRSQKMINYFLRKWLIGLVASVANPKAYNENVIVILGDQGLGKTRWVYRLLPENLENLIASKNLDPNNKDDQLMMAQYAIILMDELSTILSKKASIESFKQLTTQRSMSLRKAYGREITDFSRKASLIGTANEDHILKDLTGNRRFFVIKAKSIDQNHNVDILKVLGHAYHLYTKGELWYLNQTEIQMVNKHNAQFEDISLYRQLIIKHVRPSEKGEYLSALDIITKINKTYSKDGNASGIKIDPKYASHFGKELKSVGIQNNSKSIMGKPKRVYKVEFKEQGFEKSDTAFTYGPLGVRDVFSEVEELLENLDKNNSGF